jgi:RNA polymerase sigma-70 factor (ECF subfamily)
VLHEFDHQLVKQMPALRKFALSLTRNASDADDLVQSTMVLALRARTQFAPGTNFAAWTRRILRNRFFSEYRRKSPFYVDELPQDAVAAAIVMDDQVRLGEVLRNMSHLSAVQRETLNLIGVGASLVEVGTAMSCCIGTVKTRLRRARRKLNVLLSHDKNVTAVMSRPRSSWERRARVQLAAEVPAPFHCSTQGEGAGPDQVVWDLTLTSQRCLSAGQKQRQLHPLRIWADC